MALTEEQDSQLSQLMDLAQKGDKAAYHSLLTKITSILKGFIHKRIGQNESTEDVIQEILISVHRARHTYISSRPFAPWLFAIARYRLADYWRKTFRILEEEMTEGIELTITEKKSVQIAEGLREKLSETLARLPENQRRAVNLLKIEGRSIKEAAQELKMTESALKVTAHRAYKTLRKEFEGENAYE